MAKWYSILYKNQPCFIYVCITSYLSRNNVLIMRLTNCCCGPDVQLYVLPSQHGDRWHVDFCFGLLTPRIIVRVGPAESYLGDRNPSLLSFLPCNLFSRLVWRCIVAEPLRKSTATSRWRRIWVTVINTPTSWCSVMPANCFQTTKRLFTTSRENILFHGWGTRASWLIGRLNKLRPKHYANHLPCPLACFRIHGTSWELVLQKLGNTCYSRRVYYLLPGSLFLDVPNRKCSVKFPK